MQLLKDHISPESAYVVESYPYGGYRTQCRFWLEHKAKRGFRLVSQTLNPKNGRWNKPKASIYSRFGGAMFLDERNHVQWHGLTEYCDGKEAQDYLNTYGEAVPAVGKELLIRYVAAKVAYDEARNKAAVDAGKNRIDLPLSEGLTEARKAFYNAEIK